MSELIDYLYSRFILRDLLAKVIPGLITIFSIVTALNLPPTIIFHSLFKLPDLILFIIVYGFSFMTGMLLQFIMMKLKLTVIHVWPGDKDLPAHELSLFMANALIKSPKSNGKILRVRERYTILKEMSGNFAGGFSVLLISLFIRYLLYKSPGLHTVYVAIPTLAVLVFLLLKQNKFHAEEQKLWEIYSLLD